MLPNSFLFRYVRSAREHKGVVRSKQSAGKLILYNTVSMIICIVSPAPTCCLSDSLQIDQFGDFVGSNGSWFGTQANERRKVAKFTLRHTNGSFCLPH